MSTGPNGCGAKRICKAGLLRAFDARTGLWYLEQKKVPHTSIPRAKGLAQRWKAEIGKIYQANNSIAPVALYNQLLALRMPLSVQADKVARHLAYLKRTEPDTTGTNWTYGDILRLLAAIQSRQTPLMPVEDRCICKPVYPSSGGGRLDLVLTTGRMLKILSNADVIYIDGTFMSGSGLKGIKSLSLHCLDGNRTIHPCCVTLGNSEDKRAYEIMISTLQDLLAAHGLTNGLWKPRVVVADGLPYISDLFGGDVVRVMCYFHLTRAVPAHLADNSLKKLLLSQLSCLRRCCTTEMFNSCLSQFTEFWELTDPAFMRYFALHYLQGELGVWTRVLINNTDQYVSVVNNASESGNSRFKRSIRTAGVGSYAALLKHLIMHDLPYESLLRSPIQYSEVMNLLTSKPPKSKIPEFERQITNDDWTRAEALTAMLTDRRWIPNLESREYIFDRFCVKPPVAGLVVDWSTVDMFNAMKYFSTTIFQVSPSEPGSWKSARCSCWIHCRAAVCPHVLAICKLAKSPFTDGELAHATVDGLPVKPPHGNKKEPASTVDHSIFHDPTEDFDIGEVWEDWSFPDFIRQGTRAGSVGVQGPRQQPPAVDVSINADVITVQGWSVDPDSSSSVGGIQGHGDLLGDPVQGVVEPTAVDDVSDPPVPSGSPKSPNDSLESEATEGLENGFMEHQIEAGTRATESTMASTGPGPASSSLPDDQLHGSGLRRTARRPKPNPRYGN